MRCNRYVITTRNGRKIFRAASCERVLMRDLALEGFTAQVLRSVEREVNPGEILIRPVVRWIH